MTDTAAKGSAAATVRRLIHEARFGSLATLNEQGAPYASLVAVSADEEGRPTLLISQLALHTRNIARDGRVSLLVSAFGAADPMDSPRASLMGRVAVAQEPAVRARYLARHPGAALYADFKDFALCRMDVESAHLVEGFGRIVDVPGAQLLTDWSGAEELRAAQEGVLAHMNADHKDAVGLYATALAKAPAGDWRMIAVDPEGFEIASADHVCRIGFSQRIQNAGAIRKELVALVEQARRDNAA